MSASTELTIIDPEWTSMGTPIPRLPVVANPRPSSRAVSPMNVIDRLVSWFSPSAGLRRSVARNALITSTEIGQRGFEGARPSRHNMGWFTPSTSGNAENAPALIPLRNRARDLARNTPIGKRILDVYVTNIVGPGIRPKAATANQAANEKLDALWKSHFESLSVDADGRLNAYGIQALGLSSMVESGEVLLRFRRSRVNSRLGLDVPVQVQVLEADFLDVSKTFMDMPNGGWTINGIEYDKLGTRVGYWLFDQHPGNAYLIPQQALVSKLVPAKFVSHVFDKTRPQTDRAVSWLAPVLNKIRDLTDYEDAEIVRKKLESCLSVFVISNGNEAELFGRQAHTAENEMVRELSPGQVSYLNPGDDIKFIAPAATAGYDAYTKACLRSIAAGMGLTYEQLTTDLSGVNYSSFRAGLIEFRARAEQIRANIIIPHICTQMWRRMVDEAILAKIIPMPPGGPDYGVTWAEPAWKSVDPVKDAGATLVNIRMGVQTLSQAMAEQGLDPDEQFKAIAADFKKLDALGIVLDCDPRQDKTPQPSVKQTGIKEP